MPATRTAHFSLVIVLALTATATLQAQESRQTFRHGERDRSYLLYVPTPAAPHARPLVLLLHGRLGDGAGMAKLTGFDALADREGLVVAYPDGIRRSWADGRGATPADQEHVDDVGFLTALVREIEARELIDPARVYVAGMSNGGFMSERLACEASATFAAVGVVAATLGETLAATCKPRRPVPIAYFNGTEDPLVPYAGGEIGGGRGRALGAEESVERWRRWNGCGAAPTTRALPENAHDATAVRERSWTACREGAAVVAYRIDGGGHSWPGGWQYLNAHLVGRTTHNLDANRALWELFSAHSR